MDQQALVVVMAVFVAVAAAALVAQAILLAGIQKSMRSMKETVDRIAPRAEALLETSRDAIIQSREEIRTITQKTNDILTVTKNQVEKIDAVVTDATTRAKAQLERAEFVIDDTMNRAHQTVAMVHGGILKPLREINAVAMGIKAAVQYFSKGNRPSPDRATADEEMFI